MPGLLIPLLDTRGSTWGYQYRADNPRCDIHGKPFKYESQGGARGGCNALDFSPRTAGKIDDPKVEKWITEGALKGDALAQVDLCAISVRGVSGYRGRNAKGGKTMLASWEEVAIENSDFVIAYDSDIASNPMVAAAAVRLDDYLFHRKARTRYLVLPDGPDGKKQGVDDYLKAGHTVEELYRLVQPTLPPLIARVLRVSRVLRVLVRHHRHRRLTAVSTALRCSTRSRRGSAGSSG